jgi:hypothetical protein
MAGFHFAGENINPRKVLHSLTVLVFQMERQCVYYNLRTKYLCVRRIILVFKQEYIYTYYGTPKTFCAELLARCQYVLGKSCVLSSWHRFSWFFFCLRLNHDIFPKYQITTACFLCSCHNLNLSKSAPFL